VQDLLIYVSKIISKIGFKMIKIYAILL